MGKILNGAISQLFNTFLVRSIETHWFDTAASQSKGTVKFVNIKNCFVEKGHFTLLIFHTVHYLGYRRMEPNKETANKGTYDS